MNPNPDLLLEADKGNYKLSILGRVGRSPVECVYTLEGRPVSAHWNLEGQKSKNTPTNEL